MIELREKNGSAVFVVKAQPRSSKSRVCGLYNGGLKVNLKAAPVDDAANRECCELFSKLFRIPPSRVHIISGQSSRTKTVMIEGVSSASAALILEPFG
ncbi:MAG: DUF167 domain-containing protein [Chlorobiaceae bacterium]|nr:DUF167 domain-containing protein [Chlorobiaceae bacterium]NTV17721.1 DUF167 domain-containing protein [Chlorobiaceae bacterium]